MKAAVLIGLLLLFVHLGSSLLIGVFNITSFGTKKASNATLLIIITKYDIVLIQEVRDTSLNSTNILMDQVNKNTYKYIVSAPLWRNMSKTTKRDICSRKESVSVVKSFTYNDTKDTNDTKHVFSHPPSVVTFSTVCEGKWNFVLIPLISEPKQAVKEDILLLGDFNAGGTYITERDWPNIQLCTDPYYHWLIPDTALTNVKRTCPYDRMNVHVVPGSAQVYYFDKDLGLSQQETEAVSDHYPVEVELK